MHGSCQALKILKRKMSDPNIHHPFEQNAAAARSAAILIPHRAERVLDSRPNKEIISKC